MGRIRTVKPELFIHEHLFEAEAQSGLPLRIAFVGLFTQCDREGRFKWRPKTLKLGVLPYDELDFELVLETLVQIGLVQQYRSGNDLYGHIPTWGKHQCINNKERESEIPPPSEMATYNKLRDIDASTTRVQRVNDMMNTSLNISQEERKGREEKGRDIDKALDKASSDFLEGQLKEIFSYWQMKLKHPKAKLDKKRRSKIKDALMLGYTMEELKQAIDGCAMTPHNMGENSQRKKYDDVGLIFRDADHIERFVQNTEAHTPPAMNQIDQNSEGAI